MTAALSRMALRLLVIEALCPTGTPAAGPWPTIARNKVYDSRLVPVEDIVDHERRPVVMVYTDDVSAEPRQATGRLPLSNEVELRIEIAIPQIVSVEVEDEDGEKREELFAGWPRTDPETEAQLDLLESQIGFVLTMGPSGALLRKLLPPKIKRITSQPFRSAEERVRMAMRSICFALSEFPSDCFDPVPATTPEGIDRLPEPLRTVAKALPVASSGRATALQIADAASVMPLATPLRSAAVTIESKRIDPPAPPPPLVTVETAITAEQPS